MFSGPDFLYVDAFLPNRSTYVLSALEPVGAIPIITEATRRSLPYGLDGLRGSLSSVLSYSFFITKKMRSSLTATTFRGTLPILYIFLARSGKTIKEVNLVSINADGALVPAGQDDAQSTAPGVKIVFSGSDDKPQTLYYFRTDISNDGLKKSGFLKFAEQLGKGDSFIKSASYLPHYDSFSRIREFLLDRSQALIQDDFGIPIRYFKPDEWRLRPYGRYLGPIGEFPGRHQKGLDDLFHRGNPPRLDFGVGYRWRPNEFEPPPCREEAVTGSLGKGHHSRPRRLARRCPELCCVVRYDRMTACARSIGSSCRRAMAEDGCPWAAGLQAQSAAATCNVRDGIWIAPASAPADQAVFVAR